MNQITTHPMSTLTKFKSMKSALLASKNALDSKTSLRNIVGTSTDNAGSTAFLWPNNSRFLSYLRDLPPDVVF